VIARIHTIAAVAVAALIPGAPLGIWVYAKLASVDRGTSVARNEQVFRSLPLLPGGRVVDRHTYPLYRWNADGSLVPVTGYRTEFFVRIPRAVRPDTIVAHYYRALKGWHAVLEATDCRMLSLPPGCGAAIETFSRHGVTVTVEVAESMTGKRTTRAYGFYVSQ
jgi:hypothetical protein